MSLLPSMLKAPLPDNHAAMLESVKWTLNLGLLEVDADAVFEILDTAYSARGMLTHSIDDGEDRTDVRPLPFTGGARLACIHAPERLSIVMKGSRTRWDDILLLIGIPRNGRAVPPGDREALADSMRECLAVARSSAHRIRQQDDPMGARLHLHWLRRAAACAALQAGPRPDGRTQPRISAPCPLMGDVGPAGTEFWRPSATMTKAVEETIGDVILTKAYETEGKGRLGKFDLVIEVGPMQVKADPPSNPMDALRAFAGIMPEDGEWAELIA